MSDDTAFSRLPRQIRRALIRLSPGAVLYVPKSNPETRLKPDTLKTALRLRLDAGDTEAQAVEWIASQYGLSQRHVKRLIKVDIL